LAEEFTEADITFSEVDFGPVDCVADSEVCDIYHITGWPVLNVYLANSNEPISDNGTRSLGGFYDFVGEQLGIEAKRPPLGYVDVNSDNIDDRVSAFTSM
jgi:hypothetical protein